MRTLRWRELDSNLRFRARAGSILPVRFVADSLLEGTGFEPSVRLLRKALWGVRGSIEAQRRNGLLLTRRWREPDSNHRSRSCEGSSGRCQSETAARKAEPLTGSGPRRRCLPGASHRRLSLRGGTASSNPSSSSGESGELPYCAAGSSRSPSLAPSIMGKPAVLLQRVVAGFFVEFVGLANDVRSVDLLDPIGQHHVFDSRSDCDPLLACACDSVN